jgi:hypothetical protein
MTTTISADNGSVSGSAGLKMSSDSSGVLALQTGANSTAMTLDASGNVGIGTASPTNRLTVNGGTGSTPTIRLNGGTAADDNALISSKYNLVLGCNADGNIGSRAITFVNSTTENMRIDSSGNLLVGTTNSNSNSFKLKVQAGTDVCVGLASATSISGALTFNIINDANSANVPVDFRCNGFYISNGLATGAGTNAVKFNTTTKQLTYDTSSARYKNNIRDSIYGLDHVMQMRSAQFEYKDTGNSDVGLIAEEMQPIIPELVGLNEEGLADSVSYDRMVSVLVKAIQELKAINDTQAETINALTARIVALESK